MNRRQFLQIIASAPAAYVIDPEALLWVPRHDRIFVPSPQQVKTLTAHMGCNFQAMIELEIQYVLPHIQTFYRQNDVFLEYLKLGGLIKNVGPKT